MRTAYRKPEGWIKIPAVADAAAQPLSMEILQKRRREQPVCELFETGEGESALTAVLRTEEQRRLYEALYVLDEKRRTVIVLYYFDELSVREIAQAVGATEGTVKSRLFSARRHLRQALTEKGLKPKEASLHG